ncbi:carbohydrate ABC transporter permease [Paenibacillus sp. HWE-109]|uniref:carbohydrate ABC transporter permease n=1 Tax=Paenibacillus sp. HWE-109 TaxID=1306526 RepID=UPI001EE12112|nr:carbohydrate ABC transporter permease [Paenibacillus sp. HWE-109]UKS29518.1 carbohydrate ABC transporter permease [Paenibacillus sp. HWE-109]
MTKDRVAFQAIGYLFIGVVAILCLIPFLLLISASITENESIFKDGYRLIPSKFSLEAYQVIFKAPMDMLRAYSVTIQLTLLGTITGLFVTSMTAYVLQRYDFKYRNHFAFFFYFTTLFSGGLIPAYILVVRYLQLKDHFLSLLLPGLLSAWLIFLMRNFIKTIPDAIIESAKMDGAGDFKIFIRLIVPLATPGLATIGLFIALNYWNDWFHAMLYIEDRKLFPLQYFLYNMLNKAKFAETVVSEASIVLPEVPTESLKMAMAVVATGPIVFLYPFVQKYFVKGLTIGAIKG